MSSTLELEPSRSHAQWEGAAKATLFTSRAMLTLFCIASAVVLTIYSSSGIVKFEGQRIKWKLLLYTLELEAAVFVFVRDIMSVGIDYMLVYKGMTRSTLGHALGITTSTWRVQGSFYKTLIYAITAIGSVVAPVLLSVVLVREGSNLEPVENMPVSTNCIGGRIGKNFGATGQSHLFTMSDEKYHITPGAEHYSVYQIAGTARQVFVPKTPQIGAYSAVCNDDENVDVVAARVLGVQGLLYKCEPEVDEVAKSFDELGDDVGDHSSPDTFRLLNDSHQADGSSKKAKFDVTFAIKKGESSTAVLKILCDVTAASANVDIRMNKAGVMGMSIEDGGVSELSLDLPPRVLGEPNSLASALENSIGRKGIGIVSRWVATQEKLSEWDGLIRAVVTAYGIRAALHNTFADEDDRRTAVNVFRVAQSVEETQDMRIAALWIPVGLALISRILTWVFPSIFNGGLRQLLTWIGVENGGAGGVRYSESGFDEKNERTFFLNLEAVDGDISRLGLSEQRDTQLGLGSYRCIRRLTRRGLLRGLGFEGRPE